MKALRNYIGLMMFSVLMTACEQDELTPSPPSGLSQEYFNGSVSLNAVGGSPTGRTTPLSSLNLRFRGAGQSNFEGFILESSHKQLYGEDPSSYEIGSGEFRIIGNSGDELFGEYDGIGLIQNGQNTVYENYRIMGGTGRFLNASGTLSVHSNQICNTRETSVFGRIMLQELEVFSN